MRYARYAENADTRDGDLMPALLPVNNLGSGYSVSVMAENAAMFRRNVVLSTATGSAANKVFAVEVGKSATNPEQYSLHGNAMNGAYPFVYPFTYPVESGGSFLQYEMTAGSSQSADPDPQKYDALLYSDTKNGMLALGFVRTTQHAGGILLSESITTPYLFGVIARYGERVWGTGIPDHPDLIVYSAPYDPADWSPNADIPEDGAGEIEQPTFDGDYFTALVPFGNSLLAFKKHHLFRITGLSPDEFTFQEQYGGGTIFPETIVTYQESVYFLTENGVCVYDGVTTRPFQQDMLFNLWRNSRLTAIDYRKPTGIIFGTKYILSFPPNSTASTLNTRAVMYDFADNTWHTCDALSANAYVVDENALYLFTKNTATSSNFTKWYGSVLEIPTSTLNGFSGPAFGKLDWRSPWTDMGCKDVLQHDYQLRFWIQTHCNMIASGGTAASGHLKLQVTMETERGSRTREIVFTENVDEEVMMRFHLSGRRVRFRIQAMSDNPSLTNTMNCWFRIMGGMQLNADTTPD